MNPEKSKIIIQLSLSILMCTLFLMFIACETEPLLKAETENISIYESWSFSAKELLETFENRSEEVIGVFARVHLNGIEFEEILLVDNLYKANDVKHLPIANKVFIHEDGSILEDLFFDNRYYDIVELNNVQDFVYFNMAEFKLLLSNSKYVYLSNANFQYGSSIHHAEINALHFSTLKIEGDFNLAKFNESDTTPTANFVLGKPCPPGWNSF